MADIKTFKLDCIGHKKASWDRGLGNVPSMLAMVLPGFEFYLCCLRERPTGCYHLGRGDAFNGGIRVTNEDSTIAIV